MNCRRSGASNRQPSAALANDATTAPSIATAVSSFRQNATAIRSLALPRGGNTGKWPAQSGDPNFGTLGAQVFYIDAASDPSFVGDSGIPAEAGHYSYHPAPGVAADLQVAFRPAK